MRRAKVLLQARNRCGYCLTQAEVIGADLEIEHIIPEALGGATIEDNLWLACSYCNLYKGDRIAAVDPESGELALLFDPRRQDWQAHFMWRAAGDIVSGKTATGRAIVVALRLNRSALVRSRGL